MENVKNIAVIKSGNKVVGGISLTEKELVISSEDKSIEIGTSTLIELFMAISSFKEAEAEKSHQRQLKWRKEEVSLERELNPLDYEIQETRKRLELTELKVRLAEAEKQLSAFAE